MNAVVIRDAASRDFPAICALNLESVAQTSPMDLSRLSALHDLCCYHRVACVGGVVAGFLLAMDELAPYQNENFAAFAATYRHYLYIDRVVVAPAARGQRLASRLYEDLFGYARARRIATVTCEYNLVPANEPSRRFHDKLGFQEIGTRWFASGEKCVSLQAADV